MNDIDTGDLIADCALWKAKDNLFRQANALQWELIYGINSGREPSPDERARINRWVECVTALAAVELEAARDLAATLAIVTEKSGFLHNVASSMATGLTGEIAFIELVRFERTRTRHSPDQSSARACEIMALFRNGGTEVNSEARLPPEIEKRLAAAVQWAISPANT